MYLLETERLGLRELKLDDIEHLYPILSDAETMRFYPRPCTREEVRSWISRSMESYKKSGFGLWAVIEKKERKCIGQGGISLQSIDDQQVPEIGYQLHKCYWNRGLATELAKQCLHFGFFELALSEIFIHTWIKNIPSRRVAEKSGMIMRKEYDKKVNPKGTTMRHVVYSLKSREYPAGRNV